MSVESPTFNTPEVSYPPVTAEKIRAVAGATALQGSETMAFDGPDSVIFNSEV